VVKEEIKAPLYQAEHIPDSDLLLRRVHRSFLGSDKSKIPVGAFPRSENGISTDWEKYSTPEETRNRGHEPQANGVLQIFTRDVRKFENLVVEHTPQPGNRAHSSILGLNRY
jgi:hypothetical protein